MTGRDTKEQHKPQLDPGIDPEIDAGAFVAKPSEPSAERPAVPPAERLAHNGNFSLTLSLGGRYAGEQVWTIHAERSCLVARVQTDFAGVLPEIRRVQQSRLHLQTLESLSYNEGDGRGKATFETNFNRASGLMSLRQGRDEATAPLTTEHHDPVSLLLWLRTLGGPERASAWLTGGRALIQRLPDTVIDGLPSYTYFLRPGNAYVYVEQRAPHRLTRLIQPTDFGALEANMTPGTRQIPDRNKRRRAG